MEACLHQRGPGLLTADPIDPQAAQVLEGLDGGAGAWAEKTVGIDGRALGQDRRQAVLDVGDRLAPVTEGERKAYR
jgi:hypothetical protein